MKNTAAELKATSRLYPVLDEIGEELYLDRPDPGLTVEEYQERARAVRKAWKTAVYQSPGSDTGSDGVSHERAREIFLGAA